MNKIRTRIGVVGIIRNSEGEVLLCKMPLNRGVYPGQWALPGGGIEEGEKMEEALVREIKEEVGLEVSRIEAFWFQDDVVEKLKPDGSKEKLYMIHLLFDCVVIEGVDLQLAINDEFEEYAWVEPENVGQYDLNRATRATFKRKGWLV